MTDHTDNRKSRTSKRRRMVTGLAAGLATMALLVPTAMARPAGPAAGAAFNYQSHAPSSISTGTTAAPARASSSSDWADAGIGLGAALAITALAGLGIAPRRRVPVSA